MKTKKLLSNPTIKKEEWYGLDHNVVRAKFEGDLTFVNEFCVNGEYKPAAIYHAAKPNIKKGHKEYVLLNLERNSEGISGGFVRGMTRQQINKWRYQTAVHCLGCNTVIYSINRHHFHKCGCDNETFVDGGRDYTRYGGVGMSKIKLVTIDLLTNKIKPSKENKLHKSKEKARERNKLGR